MDYLSKIRKSMSSMQMPYELFNLYLPDLPKHSDEMSLFVYV